MRPAVGYLLIGLLFWQLGACPCGCLEHHAWLQWLVPLQDHHGLGIAQPTASGSGVLATPDHCDGPGRPYYLRDHREREYQVRGGGGGSLAHPSICGIAPRFSTVPLSRNRLVRDAADQFWRKPPGQAVLQIWLI